MCNRVCTQTGCIGSLSNFLSNSLCSDGYRVPGHSAVSGTPKAAFTSIARSRNKHALNQTHVESEQCMFALLHSFLSHTVRIPRVTRLQPDGEPDGGADLRAPLLRLLRLLPQVSVSYEEFTRLAETRLAQNSLNYNHISQVRLQQLDVQCLEN